jgi:hypothetical protein
VTSNSVANSVTSLVVGAITSLVVDLAPLVEGQVRQLVRPPAAGGRPPGAGSSPPSRAVPSRLASPHLAAAGPRRAA